MKTPRQLRLIELSKELRETVNSYKRKQDKMAKHLDLMDDKELAKYRNVIYILIENLQGLEEIKKAIFERAGKYNPSLLIVDDWEE